MDERPEGERDPIRAVVTSTDFSTSAQAGVVWARALAGAHGAALHVVHVVAPMLVATGEMAVLADAPPALAEAARERLEEDAAIWRREGLEVTCHVESGAPQDGIVEVLARVGADAAVLSTRGHSGLRNLLSGSTARRIVRRAPCPVVTVHPDGGEPVLRPERILAAVDFSRHSRRAIDEALRLLPPGLRARLRLLHSWYLPVGLEVYGYGSTSELLGHLAENREEVQKRLAELAASLQRPGLEVETRLVEGLPDAVILSEARAVDAQLVVMGTQGLSGVERWILGSVAERVVQQAPCAVLTARAPEDAS